MTLKKFTNGEVLEDTELNNNYGEALSLSLNNHVRELIINAGVYSADETDLYGEAYIDSNGRNNSVTTGYPDTTADFDSNKYAYSEYIEALYGVNYVIIEATSLTTGDFAINDCTATNIATGKWVLGCTTGTDAVRRAQIMKTLFYGSNGTDPRAEATYITSITALKTTVTRDIGMRASYVITTSGVSTQAYYTGTFADTTNNQDCSSWSIVSAQGNPTNDDFGEDHEADETDNPATCKTHNYSAQTTGARWQNPTGTDLNSTVGNGSNTTGVAVVILHTSTISWALTVLAGSTHSQSTTDFYVDNSIPLFTDVDGDSDLDIDCIITHAIPTGTFSSTMSASVCSVITDDWETGASITYKLTNTTEDTDWLSVNEVSNFTAFTSEPTALIITLTPKSSTPTIGYPSIRGYAVRAT